ncbi:DUF6544 family protein [Profundibacter sp.]
MKTLLMFVFLFAAALVVLMIWRQLDHRADRAEMARLIALQPKSPRVFDPAMVVDLPDPARRYFEYTIRTGTPLFTVADIEMTGQLSLGTKEAPNYMVMTARQVLGVPNGFVWKMSGGEGFMRMSGSDSAGWTRFWIAGLVPVARFGGTSDHTRSAFGRYVAEAVFWTPAALLPGRDVVWQAVDENTSKVTILHGGVTQDVYISVTPEGQPTEVSFPRWSDANPKGVYRLQPFGGYLSEFREIAGFRLPTHVEAGNFFGTEDYFPFYLVDVTNLRFPQSE